MSIERWRTRRYINPLGQVIDRLSEQAFTRFRLGVPRMGSTGHPSLPVNVCGTENGSYAALMAPGCDEQTINVSFHEDTLAIEGMLAFHAPDSGKVV